MKVAWMQVLCFAIGSLALLSCNNVCVTDGPRMVHDNGMGLNTLRYPATVYF